MLSQQKTQQSGEPLGTEAPGSADTSRTMESNLALTDKPSANSWSPPEPGAGLPGSLQLCCAVSVAAVSASGPAAAGDGGTAPL